MSERFFIPWIGSNYRVGMGSNHYRVLVLGASLYCDYDGKKKAKPRCPWFGKCTNGNTKDSSAFDDKCPHPSVASLHEEAKEVSSGRMTAFKNRMKETFGYLLAEDSIWDRTAFMEYVQYFLDHQETREEDLSARDFNAFLETLDDLKPNVVIVWGKLGTHVVANTLQNSGYTVPADDHDPWDFAWKYGDMSIRFVCCTHPSSSRFSEDFPTFAQKFKKNR